MRHRYWLRMLMVSVLLIGEVHLFTAEIVHHHEDVIKICQAEHGDGRYLHAAPDVASLCALCQIVRSGSVRPAVQPAISNPYRQTEFQPKPYKISYSFNGRGEARPRSPPLA